MMTCLEMIKLRSTETHEKVLKILRPIIRSAQSRDLVAIRMFRHGFIETDLCLHLYWKSDGSEPKFSSIGDQLVQVMKRYGLIDHSLWFEEK
ncbi:MAG TPA: hypothetical protein VK564_13165 [Thermodesulfobacteriota bacterium]|nr:hypothetical protein [Thermodesulfobacteriota bacterium]